MIQFLAKIFRGIHFMVGVPAPPPGQKDRMFVFAWLGVLASVIAFCTILFYVIPYLYFRR